MRVLIAGEFSGIVREAFKKQGAEVWSCDFLPSEQPGNHYQCDVLEVLDKNWNLMIAFPPCTYICGSGYHWTVRGLRDPSLTEFALNFVKQLLNAPIPHIALENPVGIISTRIRPPDQKIQPFEHGDDASKKTCLWLKNLPLLVPTNYIEPRIVNGKKRWGNQTDSGQNKLGPSENRWKERSRTYQGIANSMAAQWYKYLINK